MPDEPQLEAIRVVRPDEAYPFLACPTADGSFSLGHIQAVESFTRAYPYHVKARQTSSLLDYNFNILYAGALNRREPVGDCPGVSHFLMLHDDVGPIDPSPTLSWATLMLSLMTAQKLGVLSLVVAIKHTDGRPDAARETSTAIDHPSGDPMRVRRMRLEEFNDRPIVTSAEEPDLLINTGCMLIDMRQPWAEDIAFHINGGIRRGASGRFEAWVDSEDWNLSRQLRALGVPYGATHIIEANHVGGGCWRNR